MTTVQHSIRLSGTLDKVLRKLAEQQSVTVYAMLQRIVKSGLAAEGGSPAAGVADTGNFEGHVHRGFQGFHAQIRVAVQNG